MLIKKEAKQWRVVKYSFLFSKTCYIVIVSPPTPLTVSSFYTHNKSHIHKKKTKVYKEKDDEIDTNRKKKEEEN